LQHRLVLLARLERALAYRQGLFSDIVRFVKPVEPRTCKADSCDVVFTPTGKGAHLRRYCDVHFVGNTGAGQGNQNRSKRSLGAHCVHCGKKIPITRSKQAKYCSSVCRTNAQQERTKARKIADASRYELPDDVGYKVEMSRKGPVYLELKRRPEMVRQVLNGSMSQRQCADILETTTASVSRAFAAIRFETARDVHNATWLPSDEALAMIPIDLLDRLGDIGEGHPHVEGLVAECAAAFWTFEKRFFTVGSKQKPFIVKPFHREIVDGMIRAFAFGSRLLVLTPPRHGKSEIVIRFAAWIIVMFPNIQILWVAANKDLAGQMTSKLKGTFEYNVDLRETFLPPGKKYGDKGCSTWSKAEFTLYTRTDHTLKSPTFTGWAAPRRLLAVTQTSSASTTSRSARRSQHRSCVRRVGRSTPRSWNVRKTIRVS